MAEEEAIRVNKFIAQRLHVGRRAADDLITRGKVLLNGERPGLGARVHAGDEIIANGTHLTANAPTFMYVLLNKPTGYVCSRRQQGDTPTIYSLLPAKYQHLKPVGRLDKNSSGLLVLTNDGDLAHRMTHPSFAKTKKYEVTLDAPLQPLHQKAISEHGVTLADGSSAFRIDPLPSHDNCSWLVTMNEGRNRQIRRTFAALGYEVIRLHRTHFGPLSLHQLEGKKLIQISKP